MKRNDELGFGMGIMLIVLSIFGIGFFLGVSYLLTAGLVYAVVALIDYLGIFAIVFTWKLAFLVWIVIIFFNLIFGKGTKSN